MQMDETEELMKIADEAAIWLRVAFGYIDWHNYSKLIINKWAKQLKVCLLQSSQSVKSIKIAAALKFCQCMADSCLANSL